MRNNHERFKIELILRSSEQVSKDKRRLSADYRRRAKKISEKQKDETIKFAQQSLQMQSKMPERVINKIKISQYVITKREKEYREFTDKCLSFLTRKKMAMQPLLEAKEPKHQEISFQTMMNNIKFAYKESQKRDKESRSEQKHYETRPQTCQYKDISISKSPIHHKLLPQEDKLQLYRMIRSNEANTYKGLRKQLAGMMHNSEYLGLKINQTVVKNPFLNLNNVVCCSLTVVDPPLSRKKLLQPSNYRGESSVSTRKIQINRPIAQKFMNFNINSDYDSQYMKKLKSFLDFLYKINFSNSIYVPLSLGYKDQSIPITKCKVYIGKGNNSLLIKSLFKRRFWWEVVDSREHEGINFYWTQSKVTEIHDRQHQTEKKLRLSERQMKRDRNIEQSYQLNRKVLSLDMSVRVQRYIFKNGYTVVFDQYTPDIITNHIPNNNSIGSKKNLFKSMYYYYKRIKNKDPFDYIPKTYHIKSVEQQAYRDFVRQNQNEKNKVWIVKPGQNSNRGNGIVLAQFSSINALLRTKRKHQNGQPLTYIVQSYINKPFLYNNRKFDIRHYMLLTSVNNQIKGYWYKDGYIRTSGELYDVEDLNNLFVHLTNDAIQRKAQTYEKYEPANKVSYSEFQRYLDYNYSGKGYNFEQDILFKMKSMMVDVIKANYQTLDPYKKASNFQIFGMDFMIDSDFKPWLIEINYNPCLEINCNLLNRIIPVMVENSFRIGLDPLFPPKCHFPTSKRLNLSYHYLKNLRYELIFDEDSLPEPILNDYGFEDDKEEEQEYQDEGKQVQQLLI